MRIFIIYKKKKIESIFFFFIIIKINVFLSNYFELSDFNSFIIIKIKKTLTVFIFL